MAKKKTPKLRKVHLLIAGTLLLIVAFGSWRLFSNKQQSETTPSEPESAYQTDTNAESSSQTAENSAAKASPEDPYAGWKSHTSPYGFSLYYPPEWKLETLSVGEPNNEYLRIQPNDAGNDASKDFALSLAAVTPRSPSRQYPITNTPQALSNKLRITIFEATWSSKFYNNYQEFDCPKHRLLAPEANTDVQLKGGKYLSGESGFCNNQNSYTTKSKSEQLNSQEWKDAIKIYESLKIQ